jgi:Ca2+:H+ antiporter
MERTSGRVQPYLAPLFGILVLAGCLLAHPHRFFVIIPVAGLIVSVLAAVTNAEVIAHRVGEPLGAIILALCVTVIEASLIISMMVGHSQDSTTVARDTVFASFMIVANGVIGVSILVASRHTQVVRFQRSGTATLLATLLTMGALTLVLPSFTLKTPGPTFSTSQLLFAATSCLALYLLFIFVQTIRHPEDFQVVALPEAADDRADLLAYRPTMRQSTRSAALLLVSLVAVVGIAETLSTPLEYAIHAVGAPQAVVGLVIALLVLLPESVTAVRAATRNEVQTSINLSLGSAIASIGLTIPTIAIVSLIIHQHIALGLNPMGLVLFVITAVIASITLGSGEATLMQGAIHVVLFSAFVFLAFVP